MYKDKLDYLIGLASVDCGDDDVEMFNNLDTSKVKLDEQFYKIRDRRIRRHKRKPLIKSLQKIAARVAIFVLAVISVSVVTVAAIPSLRETVFHAIVEWYDNYLTIHYELPEIEETESESIQTDVENGIETVSDVEPESTHPTGIKEVKKPSYYQEGLIEDMVLQSRIQVVIDYYLEEQLVYSYKQLILSEDKMYFDSDSAVVSNIDINGFIAYLIEYDDYSNKTIVWTDGDYIYQLTTEVYDLKTLVLVAESIK